MRHPTELITAILIALTATSAPARESAAPEGTTRALTRGMVEIPAGDFIRGSRAYPDEAPVRRIYLDTFWIDRHEITEAGYRRCVEAKACARTPVGRYYNQDKPSKAHHPINGVTWQQAASYCRWSGKRLPTEAEWEKAARGTTGQLYAWGEAPPDCQRAVMDSPTEGNGCGEGGTWPVGSKPAGQSPYGVLNMGGNVWEWTADWYAEDAYASAPDKNPTGPTSGQKRVIRGGSWLTMSGGMRASYRLSARETFVLSAVGFRCAADAL